MTTETERFSAALEGWKLESRRIEKRSDRSSQFDKDALHFAVNVTAPNGHEWSGEYTVGSAWPILQAKDILETGSVDDWTEFRKRAGIVAGTMFGRILASDVRKLRTHSRGRTIHEAELIESLRRAFRPTVPDVVASLFADASGIDPYSDFRAWCDESGGEWDNPADALDVYEGCKEAARFLHFACGRDFESMTELAAEL